MSDCSDSSRSTDQRAVILDLGTHYCKIGFAGDDAPRAVFPSIVGRNRHAFMGIGMSVKDSYIGDEAFAKRGILNLKYPTTNAIIQNFDDFEKIMHHSFYNELRVEPDEHSVLFIYPHNCPPSHREKMTQILFETFCVPSLYIIDPSICNLFTASANGDTVDTAIICDIGADETRIIPIIDRKPIFKNGAWLDIGGRQLTEALRRVLIAENPNLEFWSDARTKSVTPHNNSAFAFWPDLDPLKEKMCFVRDDPSTATIDTPIHKYSFERLGKEYSVELGNECCDVMEILFKPNQFYTDRSDSPLMLWYLCVTQLMNHWSRIENISQMYPTDISRIVSEYCSDFIDDHICGIPYLISNSIIKCNGNYRKQLANNIVLCGGTSVTRGLSTRIENEITQLLEPFLIKPKVIATDARKYGAFVGGSILASLPEFDSHWITLDSYNEVGPTIIHSTEM